MKENKQEKFEYTVFENLDNGTRFMTNYTTDNSPSDDGVKFKIIQHCKNYDEAFTICEQRRELNYFHFFKNMSDQMNFKNNNDEEI